VVPHQKAARLSQIGNPARQPILLVGGSPPSVTGHQARRHGPQGGQVSHGAWPALAQPTRSNSNLGVLPTDRLGSGLPEQIEYDFREELARFEEERNMVYITSIERIGIEKGRAEGIAEGKAEGVAEGIRRSILQVNKSRWGLTDSQVSQKLQHIGEEHRLTELLEAAITASSREQWEGSLGS
jgi:flagellar biosynthesis/type III secretory pathway protein FliH